MEVIHMSPLPLSNLLRWHSPSLSFQIETIDFLSPSANNHHKSNERLTEWIDLSWDQPLVWLTKRDEDVSVLLELDHVLRVLGPHLVGLLSVLQRGAASVGLGPGSLELETGVLVAKLDRVE